MKKINLIGLLGAILIIISAWLPWMKVEMMGISQSVNGFSEGGSGAGAVFVVIGALCAVFFFLNKKWSNIVSLILSLGVLGLSLKYMGDAKTVTELTGATATTAFGLYVMALGGLLGVIGGAMGLKSKPSPSPAA